MICPIVTMLSLKTILAFKIISAAKDRQCGVRVTHRAGVPACTTTTIMIPTSDGGVSPMDATSPDPRI
jgi:hypothetical protein